MGRHHPEEDDDDTPDVAAGWGRFPTSAHMQHTVFSLPSRSPAREVSTPRNTPTATAQATSPAPSHHQASTSPIAATTVRSIDEPQTAVATRRSSIPSVEAFEGSELFAHDAPKSTYSDPLKSALTVQGAPASASQQFTAYLPADVDEVMGKRFSRRAPIHVLPLDPVDRAIEESQEVAARSYERQQYEEMRRELERTHSALKMERDLRRKDVKAAKREGKLEGSKRRERQRHPRDDNHTSTSHISPNMLNTILTSVYANLPRRSPPAQEVPPPTIEITKEEDSKSVKLAKRVDAIYGAQSKKEVATDTPNVFLPRPLPRVNLPTVANAFFDEGRSVSPLALPTPEDVEQPMPVNQSTSIPRYLLPTESWLCKGPELHGVHLHSTCDENHHHHHHVGGGEAAADDHHEGGLARALRLGKNDAPKSVRPFKP